MARAAEALCVMPAVFCSGKEKKVRGPVPMCQEIWTAGSLQQSSSAEHQGASGPLIGQRQDTHYRHRSGCQTRQNMPKNLTCYRLEEWSWGILAAMLTISHTKSVCRSPHS